MQHVQSQPTLTMKMKDRINRIKVNRGAKALMTASPRVVLEGVMTPKSNQTNEQMFTPTQHDGMGMPTGATLTSNQNLPPLSSEMQLTTARDIFSSQFSQR